MDDSLKNMIRRAVLNGYATEISDLLLTPDQIGVLAGFPEGGTTPGHLPPNRRGERPRLVKEVQLRRLSDRGYLTRHKKGNGEAVYHKIFRQPKD